MPSRVNPLATLAVIGIVLLGFCLYVYGGRTPLADIGLSAPNDPNVNELISQARSLQDIGKWSEANEVLQPLATNGHPIAMYHLARAYKSGWGVSADPEAARDWFKKAVRFNYIYRGETAYEIGKLYQQSTGEECDAIAVAWFNKAMSWQFDKAHVQLANHYRYGLGVKQDINSALYHYEQAAVSGYPTSTIKYAQWLIKGGKGLNSNPESALYWGRRAMEGLSAKAASGSGSAAKKLGRLYRDGSFVEIELAEAERWFRRSSRLGDNGGMHELALLLLKGPESTVRTKEALGWLRMAAELGHGGAVTELGRLHLRGSYGLSDAEAVGLFEKGTALRHPGSMEELARLLAEGRLVVRDKARAHELAQEGAKMGHEGAKSLLSELEALDESSSVKFSKS
jgi:TPR repeat protein